MKNGYLIAGGALVLLLLVKIGMSVGAKESDQEQIQHALDDSIQASKNGKPGGVMELIGKQISFNSEDASGQLGQLAQFIEKQKPDVTILDRTAVINGENAQISSPVTLDIAILGQHRTVPIKEALLIFRKEPATQWLLFPTKKWKLEQVQVPNFNPDTVSP